MLEGWPKEEGAFLDDQVRFEAGEEPSALPVDIVAGFVAEFEGVPHEIPGDFPCSAADLKGFTNEAAFC